MRVLKCLLRKSKKIYYFTFLTNFGAVRSSIPSLPVGSVWLGYRIDDPSASGQSIAKTADRRDHRYKIVGVMLFSSFNRGSNFLSMRRVHCTSSAVVDLFGCGGTSKRYPNPTTLKLS